MNKAGQEKNTDRKDKVCLRNASVSTYLWLESESPKRRQWQYFTKTRKAKFEPPFRVKRNRGIVINRTCLGSNIYIQKSYVKVSNTSVFIHMIHDTAKIYLKAMVLSHITQSISW